MLCAGRHEKHLREEERKIQELRGCTFEPAFVARGKADRALVPTA